MEKEQLKAAHNAARLLQNVALSHLNRKIREECREAAYALYREFGEPPYGPTSAGGNNPLLPI